jgi:hypothetical protein
MMELKRQNRRVQMPPLKNEMTKPFRVTHFELTIISPDKPSADDIESALLDAWGFPDGVEVIVKEVPHAE